MSPRTASPGGRRVLWAVAGLVVVAVGVLTIPLLSVLMDTRAAKNDLNAVSGALQGGDLASAREHVASAREHADEAREGVRGPIVEVWSRVPFGGTLVDDVGHLVQALAHVTKVAEIGVDLFPSVAGEGATLFRDQQVDRETLDRVIDGAHEVRTQLTSADEALSEVEATTPLVGGVIAGQRDAATAKVEPMVAALADAEPLIAELPSILGFEGWKEYLIAMLNPAELRYSGGAALSFVGMGWDQGKLQLGGALNTLSDPNLAALTRWQKVPGNGVFHPRKARVTTSTFAPSWSVSGEEMLRAWRSVRPESYDGVLAVDVVAFAELLGATGPVTVPGYGELNQDNIVEALVGSYDDYYPDATAQDSLNAGLIPAFQDRLFQGGDLVAKAKMLGAAADGRHFALYLRDDEAEEAVARLGLDGDLTPVDGDYLGVFTQNVNQSKTDFYQRRRVALDVALNADGSASNRLHVAVHNDTPPFDLPVPDPQIGYFTRWAGMLLGAFVPDGVKVDRASVDGESFDSSVRDFYGYDVVQRPLLLGPDGTGALDLRYRVPDAAEVNESTDLVYRLAIDPQGTVNPQAVDVTVRVPKGYGATSLPEGWSSDGGVLTYSTDALESTQTWEIPLEGPS